jgi:hypothetical protein
LARTDIVFGFLIATAFWTVVGLFVSVPLTQIKDFAGPLATILASSAAAFVAYRLGSSQVAVARTPALIAERTWQTANEKVVLKLFDQRLAIVGGIRDYPTSKPTKKWVNDSVMATALPAFGSN